MAWTLDGGWSLGVYKRVAVVSAVSVMLVVAVGLGLSPSAAPRGGVPATLVPITSAPSEVSDATLTASLRPLLARTATDPAKSPGGGWNHIHLTRSEPFATLNSWVGKFTVQYSYATHILFWSTNLSPSVEVAFHDQEVKQVYDVWVETQGIKFNDSHDEPPNYTFHSSLSAYRYDGKGASYIPMPGQWFEVEFIALNTWGIVGMKESISLGP